MAKNERATDPAAHAGEAPEPDRRPSIRAVGVGPGEAAFLTERARATLAGADVVVGFETVIDVVRSVTDARLLACGYEDEAATLERFADRVDDGAEGVAVLMGDPNVSGYQFLGRVERAVGGHARVVPGVSSVQVAASRARTPLERSTVVSLHRRGSVRGPLERLVADAGRRHLLVLPRPYDWMPEAIGGHLRDRGVDPALEALVFERLTHAEETVTRTTVGGLAAQRPAASDPEPSGPDASRFSDLSVLAVRAPGAAGLGEADPEAPR